MIKKEIGCQTTQHATFPFISCSECYLTQGEIVCIDFRNGSGAKMVYGVMKPETVTLIQAERGR